MKNTLHIFDIDGTLTDSVPMYLMSVTRSMINLGITDIDTDYTNYKHHTDSYALRYNYERNFSQPYSQDLLGVLEDDLIVEMNRFDPVKEINGAKSLLNFFREEGVPFCFATGALPKPAMQKLDQCGIWYDKALIATSKTHESRVGFVQDAIEKSKVYYKRSHFDTIISFGDGLWDLKTAQHLSLDFIGIGDKNKTVLMAHGAACCFSDITSFREAMM